MRINALEGVVIMTKSFADRKSATSDVTMLSVNKILRMNIPGSLSQYDEICKPICAGLPTFNAISNLNFY